MAPRVVMGGGIGLGFDSASEQPSSPRDQFASFRRLCLLRAVIGGAFPVHVTVVRGVGMSVEVVEEKIHSAI